MKKTAVSLIALSLVLVFSSADAQIAPSPGFAHEKYKEFKADKAVKYGKLPNGMRYAIQEWPTPKGEVSIRMRIAGGSLNEDENQKGLMHFLEHMAFNGSENVKEGEMVKLLEREGLAFGADTNAHTSFDETVYKLDMPKPEQLDLGLMLMRETAGKLTLDAKAIDDERGVIKGEERMRMSPYYTQWVDFANFTFDGYRFPKRVPIGDMDVVGSAPQKEFQELYYGLYRPERTFLVVVGDVNSKTAEAAIKKHFTDWKGKGKPANDPNLGKLKSNAAKYKNYVDAQLPASLSVTSLSEIKNEADTSEARRRDLLLSLATNIVNDRFQKIAREETSPFTYASVSTYDMIRSAKTSSLDIAPKTQNLWRDSLKIGLGELKSALKFGFTPAEVETAIANFEASYKKASEESEAQRSRQIVDSILSAFETEDVYTSKKDDFEWFKKVKPSLNAEAIHLEFQKAWANQNYNLYAVTPENLEGGEGALKSAMSYLTKVAAKPPKIEALKKWDYVDFGTPAAAPIVETNKEIDVSFAKFANNVRLVFKKTDYEKGRVRVKVRFGEGKMAMPKDKVGLDFVASSSFADGGLGHFNIDELNKALAGKIVSTGFGVDETAFEFSSTTNQNDFLLQMQVFAAYLTDPAWRPDGFNQLKAAKEMIYRDERSTPANVLGRKLAPYLASFDKSQYFPTPQEFDALKLEDAKTIIDKARKDSAIEIIVTGDISQEAVISAIGQTFAALPTRKDAPEITDEMRRRVFTAGRNYVNLDHDGRADQSIAAIYWPAGDFGDGSQGRALNILRDMFHVKLTDILREKEGATYSPQVDNQFSNEHPGYGYLGVILDLKPNELDRIIALTESIAKDFAEGKIDEDLLKRARTPSVASFDVSRANNPWWLGWLSGASWDKNKITIIRDGKKQYENITLDQMKEYAKKYFDPAKAQIIKIVPSEKVKAANDN